MTPDQIAALPYRPCVGVMLMNPQGLIFAGQRIDTPGAWQMPQGGIDPGEIPRVAALRELSEETGIAADRVSITAQTADWIAYDLPHDIVPRIWKGRFRGQKQHWFLMQFQGSDAEIRIDSAHPEFSEWTWIAPGDLLASIVPFKRQVYARVFDEFASHLP